MHHPETNHVIGFLREWIAGRRLCDVDLTKVSLEKRRLWKLQICETLAYLHSEGVFWGDGKPANVVIDEYGDAWLIDFGGGFTSGWVEESLTGTKDGDMQAIQMITKFLMNG